MDQVRYNKYKTVLTAMRQFALSFLRILSFYHFDMRMKKILFLLSTLVASHIAMAQLPAKPEDISPLLVGETMPKATLLNLSNAEVKTESIFKAKKTILIFYRGGWCPYCNLHLSEVGRIENDLLALGYQIVAISPDAPRNLASSKEKLELTYTLLSDTKGDLVKAAGLAFKAPAYNEKELIENQGKGAELFLPVPSLFILNEKSEILFEYINPNFKQRISGYLLLAAARVCALNK